MAKDYGTTSKKRFFLLLNFVFDRFLTSRYAVSVFENVNLAQLWNFTREKDKLQILHGTLQFHNNPQLCYQTIGELASVVNLKNNITEHDVSPNSNGNKAVCKLIL